MTEKQYSKSIHLTTFFMGVLVVLLIATLCSCTTAGKATRYFDKHPTEAAKYCGKTFPTKDSTIRIDSIFTDTSHTDSVYISVPCVGKDSTVYVKVACPPAQIVTKNHYTKETVYQKNTAELFALNAELSVANNTIAAKDAEIEKKDKQIAELKDKVKDKNRQLWYYRFTLLLLLLWIFRRPLLALINPVKPFSL